MNTTSKTINKFKKKLNKLTETSIHVKQKKRSENGKVKFVTTTKIK